MGFDLLEFVAGMLGGLNLDDISAKASAWLREKGAEYPDIKDRTDALEAYLKGTLIESTPNLDPARLANTIKGIASDIVNGTAGVDPDSWTLSG